MKDRNHIDDLFRDELSNHQVTPPKSNWNGMKPALDNMRLEHLAKVKLANQAITPAKSVWQKIATKLWWEQFIHFSALKFNIYYAALGVVGITGGIIISNQVNTEIYQPEKQLRVEMLQSSDAYNQADLLEMESLNPTQLAKQSNQIEINLNPQNSNKAFADNNNTATELTAQLTPHTTDAPSENTAENETELNTNLQGNLLNQETENQEDPIISQAKIKGMPLILHQLVPILISGQPLIIKNYAKRTDTLGYDYQGEPIVKDLSFFEQGYSFGAIFLKQSFEFLNPEMQNANINKQDYSQFSYRFGIRFNYVKNNYILQTGFYLANLNNQFKHTTTHLIIRDDTPKLPYFEYSWPYESDTVIEYQTHTYNNSYSFIELPILAGVHLENEKIAVNLKTGPIFNLITGVNSKLLLESNQIISNVHKSDFIRPGIRWEFSADLIYRFNNQVSVFVEPSYVHDLTNMFNKNYEVKSHFEGYSGSVGIYYRF
ncbi:MAG: hypothetical protein PF448_03115 [Bacteroidales bacterium]|jgi:hypothetical protein|nr:hypothetical protein [Bacteroidales bacterium]